MELTGTVNNGVVVLDGSCDIPDGTKVIVRIATAEGVKHAAASALGKRLLKHAGTVDGLPEDLAEQHDHYVHGTAKR